MEKTPLNRLYLETLSTADLVELAEENGIDIPEGLNRRFIIGELLELAIDQKRTDDNEQMLLLAAEYSGISDVLPETYNETRITVLLRDPGWVFVYWDFHTTLFSSSIGNHRFETFFLRINSLSENVSAVVTDFFDIEVGPHDRKWYIHLSNRDFACRVDLYSRLAQEKEQLLVKSAEIIIPYVCVGETLNVSQRKYPPLVELSGIHDLRKNHFKNHRQSFN